MSSVEFRNVSKRYGNLAAVDDLSLSIESGELVTLLGPSGCGKTTSLGLVAGFMRADTGSILINRRAVDRDPPNQRNSTMVFQGYALFPHLTVEKNIAFGLEMRRVPRAEIGQRVAESLKLVQLSTMADRYPRQLSGGQQQRVALARALVVSPDVLLLDEPLSNLDAKLREEMRDEIRRVQQAVGITAIYVTHDQEEALAISDRIVVMDKGRIEQVGSPADVYRSPKTSFVAQFIGSANLLPVQLSQCNGEWAQVVTEDGITVEVKGRCNGNIGERATLMVRPEDIEVRRTAEGGNEYSAVLDGCTFLGAVSFATLRLSSCIIRARVSDGDFHDLENGAAIRIGWAPDRCRLIFEGK